mgnify:CR=1 FL=1
MKANLIDLSDLVVMGDHIFWTHGTLGHTVECMVAVNPCCAFKAICSLHRYISLLVSGALSPSRCHNHFFG